MKTCPRCGETKPLTDFWRDKQTISGYAVYCIACGRRRNAEKYRARAARDGRQVRDWRPLAAVLSDGRRKCQRCGGVFALAAFVKNAAKSGGIGSYCKPCHVVINNENKQKLHGGTASYHLQHRYGITSEDRDEMRDEQAGLCLICLDAPAVHIDHDHETGAVRGMLCFNCNGGLGQFKDDPERLIRAEQYLNGGLVRLIREADGYYSMARTTRLAPPPGDGTVALERLPLPTGEPESDIASH